jgi:hypothetical protein
MTVDFASRLASNTLSSRRKMEWNLFFDGLECILCVVCVCILLVEEKGQRIIACNATVVSESSFVTKTRYLLGSFLSF